MNKLAPFTLALALVSCETPLRSAAATAQVAPGLPNEVLGHYWCFYRAPEDDPHRITSADNFDDCANRGGARRGGSAVFALVAVVSSAHAGKQCDTTHTSDLRRIWQCDDVCVHIFGNPPYYITFDGVKDGKIVRSGTFEWKKDADIASLNGKRCKKLPQTYDYD